MKIEDIKDKLKNKTVALASANEGKPHNIAVEINSIENGKIVKSYTFYNEADALKQLGYIFIDSNEN
jgi:hypothetical protein